MEFTCTGSACGCDPLPSMALLCCFLDRPVLGAAPILCIVLSNYKLLTSARHATHVPADDAIRLAISEYLHVDCRLTHAMQLGRLRSHCARIQRAGKPQQFANAGAHALTLVLRSTHSSQLRVGLFLFCFFLGGVSDACVVALEGGLGLVEDSALMLFIAQQHSGEDRVDSNVSGDKTALVACALTPRGCVVQYDGNNRGWRLFPESPESQGGDLAIL